MFVHLFLAVFMGAFLSGYGRVVCRGVFDGKGRK